jgi:hypothetical protein
MSAANALNAFMTTRQYRQGEEDRAMALEDRQRAIGLENTRGKINALMMQPGEGANRATGMDAGFTQDQSAPQPSRMDQARQMAVQSGSSELMGQFQQQLASMDAATREQNAAMFGLVGQVANSLRGVPVTQRGTALMAMAPQLQAAGVPDQEIQNYAQILSDPQSSDAVLEALSSRVLEAQSVFDAYAPQMQAENEVLSRFQNGQQVQGAVNPNATANRAIEQFGADTNRMNANTNRMNADTARMEADGQGGPEWVTLAPGDPRRAGFDDGDVVQFNERTGQIARRSQDQQARQFNQQQVSSASYANRMVAANEAVQRVASEGFQGNQVTRGDIPVVGGLLRGSEERRYDQAVDDFITALLREESGAAIGQNEFDTAYRTYFPTTGDDPATIEQKSALRERAIQNMVAGSQGAFETMFGAAPSSSAQQAVQITTGEEYSQLAPGTRYIDPNGVERVKQ